MKKFMAVIFILLMGVGAYQLYVSGKFPGLRPNSPRLFEAVFPGSVKLSHVFGVNNLPEKFRREELLFDVSEKGVPSVFHKNVLMSLGPKPKILRVKGVPKVDRYTWAGDVLLMIWKTRLGTLTKQGFQTLAHLPYEGMRLTPGGNQGVYLYGGGSPSKRKNLYFYHRNEGLVFLLKGNAPIEAVSGDGLFTFLAMGRNIYLLGRGKPLSLIYEAKEGVTSLAMAPPSGLFYATPKRVGYIYDKWKGYTFVQGKGGELITRGGALYLSFPGEEVLKAAPITAFHQFVKSFQTAGQKTAQKPK